MTSIKKLTILGIVMITFTGLSISQSINCDHIYWLDNDRITDFDPATKTYKNYSFGTPPGSSGLAIAPDPRKREKLTFYTTVEDILYYFDGSKWTSTNHNVETVNIAGGGDYMYILDGIGSRVYKYNFKGNATLLLDLGGGFKGPYDIVCDKLGNFYLMHTNLNKLIQYDPNGKVLAEYELAGLANQSSGGGFAYRDGIIYANVSGGSMIGEMRGGKIVFTKTSAMPQSMNDFASCPLDVFVPDEKEPEVEDVVYTDGNVPLTIKDREVKLQNTITVSSTEFDIEIWDKSVVDGDSISLNLNGKWILENYGVVKTKHKVRVKINPRSPNNYLILYALNLGEISPNTAAVAVLVDGEEYKLTLTSDLKSSGALNFTYKPK